MDRTIELGKNEVFTEFYSHTGGRAHYGPCTITVNSDAKTVKVSRSVPVTKTEDGVRRQTRVRRVTTWTEADAA